MRFPERLRKILRVIADTLPPFPRPPSPRKIAAWWRREGRDTFRLGLPTLPSRQEIAEWWRNRRGHEILPPLPRPPSPRKIVESVRSQQTLPPLPSASGFVAWIGEEPRRRRFVAWPVILLLLIGGFFLAGPRASRYIKGWQSRRLAAQAELRIEQRDWNGATRLLQDAFQLKQTEPETWRAYARFLSRTNQGALAVQWWQKIAQTRPLSIQDRRDYSSAALNANELAIAADQIATLLQQPGQGQPEDLILAAQLATLRGYSATAVNYAGRVLANQEAAASQALAANLVILSNTSPGSDSYQKAFTGLTAAARDQTNPASPEALAVLARNPTSSSLTTFGSNTLAIRPPQFVGNPMSLVEIADGLEHNPNSRPVHRIIALEIRARADPTREDAIVQTALKQYGEGDDETLMSLGAWFYSRHRYQAMLQILPLTRAEHRRELLAERIDALAALNRMQEVKETLLTEHPVLEPAFQHMYLAAARAKLGENASIENEWYRALESADSPRTLFGLAEYAAKSGKPYIADQAYARLIRREPGLKNSYLMRLRLAEGNAQTASAHEQAEEIARLWPEDEGIRVHEIYLRLLLDRNPNTAAGVEPELSGLLARNPWNGMARSALALARLDSGKPAASMETLTEFHSDLPSSVISLPIYAAVLSANGWKDKANQILDQLATQRMLPEERALLPKRK